MQLLQKIKSGGVILGLGLLLQSHVAWANMETDAKYAFLYDYNTGEVLLEKNADELMHPASMTKLMTAYLTFDALKRGDLTLDSRLPVSERAWKKGGSKMFVKEGDDVALSDLLRGVIVQSGNDACIVIAEGLAGSEETFAEDMNFVAERLGMSNTNFKNATGWPDDEHVTTVRDLVTLARHLIDDYPEHYYLYSTTEFTYNKIKQNNRNGLLYRNIGADGLKTGYTEKSGYGIVASAEQEGRRLILAINGLDSAKKRIAEAERLLRHGFRDFKNVTLYRPGDVVENAEVWMGKEKTVPLVANELVEFTVNKRVSQRPNISVKVAYNSPWPAPVKAGTHIANLSIEKDGKPYREIPLYAGQDVEKKGFFSRVLAKFHYILLGS